MDNDAPSAWSVVKIPAAITLLVTILRLVGELQGWDHRFFSNVAPGGEWQPGWVGISWLMPIFGFWFGFRLRRRTGEPASPGRGIVLVLVALGVVIGSFWALREFGLLVMPNAEKPGEPQGLVYALPVLGVAGLIALVAWWRLGCVMLLYAFLARLPVVAVTYLAVQYDWQTHYTKLPVGSPVRVGDELFMYLALPQITFWILATLLTGGLCGCLGAIVAGRKSPAASGAAAG